MADSDNFTMPSTGAGGMTRPTGPIGQDTSGWSPEQWDAWMQQEQQRPAQYDPRAGNNPVGPDGRPLVAGGAGDVGRFDKPRNDATENGQNVGQSWGGYSGTNVLNPDGTVRYDSTLNGQAADVNRLRGLADKAGGAPTYQLNYGNANAANQNATNVRAHQDEAIGIARGYATGGMTPAQALAKKTLAQGGQMQQAAALSTRGGPLAQAAALRAQRSRAAAYNQRGNNAISALRADEMEQGRNSMAGLLDAQRQGDATSQYNNANQAIQQGQIESQQRDLSQQGQLGYESMAGAVQKAGADATISQQETAQGLDAAASARAQRNADRDLNNASTLANTAASGAKSAYADDDEKTSDARAKRSASIADYVGGR